VLLKAVCLSKGGRDTRTDVSTFLVPEILDPEILPKTGSVEGDEVWGDPFYAGKDRDHLGIPSDRLPPSSVHFSMSGVGGLT